MTEMLTIRRLDRTVKERLRERAARHGHSMEAEVRDILTQTVTSGDDAPDMIDYLRELFVPLDVQPGELELPRRSDAMPREISFDE